MNYKDYISENLGQSIEYTEYIAENIGQIDYSEYIAENLSINSLSNITFAEYIAEALMTDDQKLKRLRKKKLIKLNETKG